MTRRQTALPSRWFVADRLTACDLRRACRAMPRGIGIIVLGSGRQPISVRSVARSRRIAIVEEEKRGAMRVHGMGELRRALLRRTPLILLSPLYPTRSHPDWKPLPRMRAAALARLARRRLIALGGMDEKRFRCVERLGFQGWAGISAWI